MNTAPECERCDDSGWIECFDVDWKPVVKRCSCDRGELQAALDLLAGTGTGPQLQITPERGPSGPSQKESKR